MARERPPRRCSGAAEEKRRLRRPPFSSRATGGPAPARHTQPRARYQPPRSQRARPAAASSGSAWGASAAAARTVGTDMPPPPRPAACRAAARATRRVPRCTRAWLSVCVCAAVCGREAAQARGGARECQAGCCWLRWRTEELPHRPWAVGPTGGVRLERVPCTALARRRSQGCEHTLNGGRMQSGGVQRRGSWQALATRPELAFWGARRTGEAPTGRCGCGCPCKSDE